MVEGQAPPKATENERALIQLWRDRPPEKHTGNDVLIFYGWLEKNRPELLDRRRGDPYTNLQALLQKYTRG